MFVKNNVILESRFLLSGAIFIALLALMLTPEQLQQIRDELFTAVVGDILDMMGHTQQFLPARIQPLREDMVVLGRAMPALEVDDVGGEGPGRSNPMMNQPFGLMQDPYLNLDRQCAGGSSGKAAFQASN